MKLLVEEATKDCFSSSGGKTPKASEQVTSGRTVGNLEPFPNQFDKAEEPITFYTFAPLVEFKSSKRAYSQYNI